MALSIVQAVGRTGERKTRSPTHTFNGWQMPFAIQPFLCAPVLPGETLKKATIQCRAITDPVANPLIGWWLEHYLFYVKHRDLSPPGNPNDGSYRTEVEKMVLDPEWSKTALDDPTSQPEYDFRGGNINWTKMCLQRVVEEFFRNEGEAWDVVTIANMPAASINNQNILQSAELADNVDDPVIIDEGGTAVHNASELDAAWRQWEYMRNNDLTQMDYADFLKTYGVRTSRVEQHKPELLRYSRQWQYPSSVVNPASGVPSSAVSWAIQETADKDRFFIEPGFILGVQVFRPKVYMSQAGNAVQYLDRALDWMPAVLRDDVYSSLKKYANGTGPAGVVTDTDGYWVDMRDLFMHGDQFVFGPTGVYDGMETVPPSTANYVYGVDLPTPGMNVEYPDFDDAKGVFLDIAANRFWCRSDGVVSLRILGTQQDHT